MREEEEKMKMINSRYKKVNESSSFKSKLARFKNKENIFSSIGPDTY